MWFPLPVKIKRGESGGVAVTLPLPRLRVLQVYASDRPWGTSKGALAYFLFFCALKRLLFLCLEKYEHSRFEIAAISPKHSDPTRPKQLGSLRCRTPQIVYAVQLTESNLSGILAFRMVVTLHGFLVSASGRGACNPRPEVMNDKGG